MGGGMESFMKNVHGGDIYRYEKPVVDFSANINPLGTPESVKETIRQSIETIGQYPDPFCRKLREQLAKHHDIAVQQVICGNGAADLIYRLIAALRPKHALVLAPCFAEYEEALLFYGAKVERYALDHRDFSLKTDILDRLTEELDLVCLCNPNNPTGITVDVSLLHSICERAKEKQIFVLLDECFLDFTEKEKSDTFIKKSALFPNLFLLRAFTKMYAVAGIRLGYGICKDESLLERMYQAGPPWNVSVLAQAAGSAALQAANFQEESRAYIKRERTYLYQALERIGVTYWKSEANFILFQSRTDLKERLLEEGILIRDCSNYYNLTKGYFRIAVKKHAENQRLIQAMEKILISSEQRKQVLEQTTREE